MAPKLLRLSSLTAATCCCKAPCHATVLATPCSMQPFAVAPLHDIDHGRHLQTARHRPSHSSTPPQASSLHLPHCRHLSTARAHLLHGRHPSSPLPSCRTSSMAAAPSSHHRSSHRCPLSDASTKPPSPSSLAAAFKLLIAALLLPLQEVTLARCPPQSSQSSPPSSSGSPSPSPPSAHAIVALQATDPTMANHPPSSLFPSPTMADHHLSSLSHRRLPSPISFLYSWPSSITSLSAMLLTASSPLLS